MDAVLTTRLPDKAPRYGDAEMVRHGEYKTKAQDAGVVGAPAGFGLRVACEGEADLVRKGGWPLSGSLDSS